MDKKKFAATLNEWGAQNIPFLFIVDFEFEKPVVLPLRTLDSSRITFDINGFSNIQSAAINISPSITVEEVIDFESYKTKFDIVYRHLNYGDSYLTNLTTLTRISLSHGLKDIFLSCKAPYKLFFENKFLVFSPECFIRINDGRIFSFPMKGTIDADIMNAEEKILADQKELAEHITIVDLIRNDLSQFASNVTVTRFRYLDKIRSKDKNLLQVSSEISGDLPQDYRSHIGDLLVSLLPAGSISGAPKPKTLQIIREAEKEKRGYYTGVFGYFDGHRLDSGVMIRFIEKKGDQLYYRSGGGITTQSDARQEYEETINKVYVPVD